MSESKVLFIRETREKVSTPFVFVDKISGFSAVSTSMELEVIAKTGRRYHINDLILVRIFDDKKNDVTSEYTWFFAKMNHQPCTSGEIVQRMMITRKSAATSGQIHIYAWIDEPTATKVKVEKSEIQQWEDLENKYRPAHITKFDPLLPTPEALRLAGLFSFLDNKETMLRNAGFVLPEEE